MSASDVRADAATTRRARHGVASTYTRSKFFRATQYPPVPEPPRGHQVGAVIHIDWSAQNPPCSNQQASCQWQRNRLPDLATWPVLNYVITLHTAFRAALRVIAVALSRSHALHQRATTAPPSTTAITRNQRRRTTRPTIFRPETGTRRIGAESPRTVFLLDRAVTDRGERCAGTGPPREPETEQRSASTPLRRTPKNIVDRATSGATHYPARHDRAIS